MFVFVNDICYESMSNSLLKSKYRKLDFLKQYCKVPKQKDITIFSILKQTRQRYYWT